MKNAAYISTTVATEKPESSTNTIKVKSEIFKIQQEYTLDEDLNNLESILNTEKGRNRFLIFDDFSHFRQAPEKLKLLKNAQVKGYRFKNLPNLNKDSIDAIIELLNFNKTFRSKQIKKGLEKAREKGERLGNPEIGKKKGKLVMQRKLKSFLNPVNRKARSIVVQLYEKEKRSLNQIAKYLNEHDLAKEKGSKFYPKSVQRLYDKYLELKRRFEPLPVVEGNLNDESKSNKKEIKIEGLESDTNFDSVISFTIKSPLKERFEVLIYDNEDRDQEPVFDKVYQAIEKKVVINLNEHALLPGVHYISIKTEEDQYSPIFKRQIKLREELLVS